MGSDKELGTEGGGIMGIEFVPFPVTILSASSQLMDDPFSIASRSLPVVSSDRMQPSLCKAAEISD